MVNPVNCSETSTTTVPFPALRVAVREPYEVVLPYSTYQLVASPPGSTLPVTVALVPPTDVAGPVTAVGALATACGAAARARPATTATARRRPM